MKKTLRWSSQLVWVPTFLFILFSSVPGNAQSLTERSSDQIVLASTITDDHIQSPDPIDLEVGTFQNLTGSAVAIQGDWIAVGAAGQSPQGTPD